MTTPGWLGIKNKHIKVVRSKNFRKNGNYCDTKKKSEHLYRLGFLNGFKGALLLNNSCIQIFK